MLFPNMEMGGKDYGRQGNKDLVTCESFRTVGSFPDKAGFLNFLKSLDGGLESGEKHAQFQNGSCCQ